MRPDVKTLRKNFELRKRIGHIKMSGSCDRCGMTSTTATDNGRRLELHHIKSISDCVDDGVTDTSVVNNQNNLNTLCYWCHREWHTHWETFNPDYNKYFNSPAFKP